MTAPSKKARLTETLRAGIRSGQWAPGARLPSARELADEHGVSEATAREALGTLKAEGLAVTAVGAGTFVPDVLPVAGLSLEERLAAVEAWQTAHERGHP